MYILVVFEKVALGDHNPCKQTSLNAKKVVKFGFYNIATDRWIAVDGDTVSLQVIVYPIFFCHLIAYQAQTRHFLNSSKVI